MAVAFNEKSRLFTITTENSEYQLMADEYGVLRHLWYGAKVGMSMDYLCVYPDVGFSGNIYEAETAVLTRLTRCRLSIPAQVQEITE